MLSLILYCSALNIMAYFGIVRNVSDEQIIIGLLREKKSSHMEAIVTNCEGLNKVEGEHAQMLDLVQGMLHACISLQVVVIITMELNSKATRITNLFVENPSKDATLTYTSQVLRTTVGVKYKMVMHDPKCGHHTPRFSDDSFVNCMCLF